MKPSPRPVRNPGKTKPKATGKPKATAKPKATGKPKATAKPKATVKPKATAKPKATVKPKATSASRVSKPRTPTEKPEGSKPIEGAVRAGDAGAERAAGEAASRLIDGRIRELEGWRGETLARQRALILEADPEMIEEWKWMGTPVWSHHGIVCTGEAYANIVKHTFAKGARLPDPSRLFNSSLEGNTRRAIDIHEGEKIDAAAFKALVRAAVALNTPPPKKR